MQMTANTEWSYESNSSTSSAAADDYSNNTVMWIPVNLQTSFQTKNGKPSEEEFHTVREENKLQATQVKKKLIVLNNLDMTGFTKLILFSVQQI